LKNFCFFGFGLITLRREHRLAIRRGGGAQIGRRFGQLTAEHLTQLVRNERSHGHVQHRLLFAEHIPAHPPHQPLNKCVGLGLVGALPHKADVCLGHHLARPQPPTYDDHSGHQRRILQAANLTPATRETLLLSARDGDLCLFARVQEDGKGKPPANATQDRLILLVRLAAVHAQQHVLRSHVQQQRLKALRRLEEREGRLEPPVALVLGEPVVAVARLQRLHVLGIGRLHLTPSGDLGIRRRIHREQVCVLLLQHSGIAVQKDAVLGEKEVELLPLGLDHMRLVHDDERVLDVQLGVLEVLMEDDLNAVLPLRVAGERVSHRLALELGLGTATDDICARDAVSGGFQHLPNEALERARLA